MKELSKSEAVSVSGGNPIVGALAVLGAIILVGDAIDLVYNAAGAFADGYNEHDTY